MKSYGQFCALAKALDRIGDRWTLLIVRELLIGPRRYSQIRAALPGIATNLLADRLRELEADGIVMRADGAYGLTELGRGLEGAVHELVRWGGRWMQQKGADEYFRTEWLVVALAALLPSRAGKVEIHLGTTVIGVDSGQVSLGPVRDPDAVVHTSPDVIMGVATGVLPFSTLNVTGDRSTAQKVLANA